MMAGNPRPRIHKPVTAEDGGVWMSQTSVSFRAIAEAGWGAGDDRV